MPTFSALLFKMKKATRRVISFALLTLSFFINPLSVGTVEADYLKVTSPAEVTQNSQFIIDLEISDKPNTTYAIKARIGSDNSHLNKGQTLDEQTGVWLSDSVSWDRFPKIKTDEDGHWVGKLKAKPGTSAALGKNLLVVRLKNQIDNSMKDSESYQITVLEPARLIEPPKVETKGEPILNEFLAAGGPEWVEIKNKGNGKIDLAGWLIDDEEGKSSPFEIPSGTILEAGQFYVANFSSPKLNDITDSVRLLRPDSSLVEEYRYSSPEKGKSFAKDSAGNWFISNEPTPGSNNPNPPEVSGANTTSLPKTPQVLADSSTSEEQQLSSTLPKLSESTASAKIATVSASFKDQAKNSWFSKIPLFLGGLLMIAAAAVMGKNIVKHFKDKTVAAESSQ